MSDTAKKEFAERLRYRKDPLSWAVDKMGVRRETIEWSLNPGYENHRWDSGIRLPGEDRERPCKDPVKALLDAVGAGFRRIAVMSAVSCNKTFTLGRILVPWFLDSYPSDSRVFTFASKGDQLDTGIWHEVGQGLKEFRKFRPGIEKLTRSIYMDPDNKENREAWAAHGIVAGVDADEESAARAQGIHGPSLLFLFEEMPGIKAAIINAIRRTATAKNNLIVGVGNPNSEVDELNRFAANKGVLVIRISALDHPNYVLDDPDFISGAVTRFSVQEILDEPEVGGDKTHPAYLSRVRGVTPVSSGDCLFHANTLKAIKEANSEKVGHQWVWREPRPENIVRHIGGSEGRTIIFDKAKQTHLNRYLIFGDVAGDQLKGDWHFAVVFDRVDRKVCASVMMRGIATDYSDELLRLAKQYYVKDPRNNSYEHYRPTIAYEVNGVGSLHRDKKFRKYGKLYRRINADATNPSDKKMYGWNTNRATRPDMMAILKSYGHELTYEPSRIPDEEIYNQMKSFCKNRKGKYEAVDGFQDDAVMALAGALIIDQEMTMKGRLPVRVSKFEKKENQVPRKTSRRKESPFKAKKLPRTFAVN